MKSSLETTKLVKNHFFILMDFVLSFLPIFRISANPETRCVDRVVLKWENALSCWLSVSALLK